MPATRLPPGPKGRFLTGNLPDFAGDPLGYLTQSAREYGDVVSFRWFNRTSYVLNHPDHIEQALATHHRDVIKIISLRTPFMRRLIGNGLVTSEGDFWVRQRRLAQPAFHRERIDAYGQVMVDYTTRLIATWRPAETRDVHEDMMRLALDIVAKTLFNVEVDDHADEAGAALQVLMREFATRWSTFALLTEMLPTPSVLRARSAVRRLERIVYRIIAQRRADGRDTGDLLSMLLHARDEDGSQMTDRQLRDEAMTFLFAGHETTALALSWTWYLLSQHPEVEARLVAELDSVLGGRRPTVADLPRLTYSEWVINESMRLYPPVWSMGREAVRDCEIGGYRVPAGSQIVVSQWVIHRDPRFFDRPDEFDPHRWDGDLARRLPRFAYFPFGGGPRACIGHSFAMMEAVLVLATIAQRFRLTLSPGHRVEPWPTMTLRPREGVRVVVTKRAACHPANRSATAPGSGQDPLSRPPNFKP